MRSRAGYPLSFKLGCDSLIIDNGRSETSCDGYSLSRLTEDLSWSVSFPVTGSQVVPCFTTMEFFRYEMKFVIV